MLVISSREFRQNQKMYFEKVDHGEKIIVQRGKDKAYHLCPVSDNDLYFNDEMITRIEESIKEYNENGPAYTIRSKEDIKNLFKNL